MNYTRPSVTHMGHDTSLLWIISPTVKEAFGGAILTVAISLVCRTPTSNKFYSDARIELAG